MLCDGNKKYKELEWFEKMVMMLAEKSENEETCLGDEISKVECAINNSGFGTAYFNISGSDWNGIQVLDGNRIPYKYKENGVRLFAEYYDGYQAPFAICKWKSDFKQLEELLKNTSSILWKLYKNVLSEK